jgi:hypothetical protein
MAGPRKNLMPSDSSIFLVPQAIILVCRAVKRPAVEIVRRHSYISLS